MPKRLREPAFTALNADVSGTPTQAAAVVAAPVVLTHPGQVGAETINGADHGLDDDLGQQYC